MTRKMVGRRRPRQRGGGGPADIPVYTTTGPGDGELVEFALWKQYYTGHTETMRAQLEAGQTMFVADSNVLWAIVRDADNEIVRSNFLKGAVRGDPRWSTDSKTGEAGSVLYVSFVAGSWTNELREASDNYFLSALQVEPCLYWKDGRDMKAVMRRIYSTFHVVPRQNESFKRQLSWGLAKTFDAGKGSVNDWIIAVIDEDGTVIPNPGASCIDGNLNNAPIGRYQSKRLELDPHFRDCLRSTMWYDKEKKRSVEVRECSTPGKPRDNDDSDFNSGRLSSRNGNAKNVSSAAAARSLLQSPPNANNGMPWQATSAANSYARERGNPQSTSVNGNANNDNGAVSSANSKSSANNSARKQDPYSADGSTPVQIMNDGNNTIAHYGVGMECRIPQGVYPFGSSESTLGAIRQHILSCTKQKPPRDSGDWKTHYSPGEYSKRVGGRISNKMTWKRTNRKAKCADGKVRVLWSDGQGNERVKRIVRRADGSRAIKFASPSSK